MSGLVVGLAALWGGASALAGDSAHLDTIGYSQDGRYFAFEQFGIQDGSGFPYSDIFIIDLDTDRFTAGSPFRVRIDEEMAQLTDARAAAREAADSALADLDITRPAIPYALRGDGVVDDEGLTMSYGVPGFGLADIQERHELSLELFYGPENANCLEWFGDRVMAFALFAQSEDGESREIHRDTSVPSSRNCTVTYKFYGVFAPFYDYSNESAVAVLSVWSHGFEGPDRRFIALPVGVR